jgi:hypothetical protein
MMKNTLVAVAIAAAIAASAAQADVSVCVNNKNGKARFATACSKNETQQFLTSGGGSGGGSSNAGDLRYVSRYVTIPAGTSPGSWTDGSDFYFKENVVASVSCDSSEVMVDYNVLDARAPHGPAWEWSPLGHGNRCVASVDDANSISMGVYCGKDAEYYGYPSVDGPTSGDTPIYMLISCIKK